MADEKNPRLRSSIGARPVEKEVGSGQGEITIVDAREIKHADDALRAFADYEGAGEVMDEATNRRLVRKIDRRIMPLLCVVYGLNFLDSIFLSIFHSTSRERARKN